MGFLSNASFFVFPSFNESMSMMLLEAVSVGTPVIASDIEANTDIFGSEEVLLFKNKSVDDLAKKIEWALTHKDQMKLRAKKAFIRAQSEYNWPSIASKYDVIYNRLIKR